MGLSQEKNQDWVTCLTDKSSRTDPECVGGGTVLRGGGTVSQTFGTSSSDRNPSIPLIRANFWCRTGTPHLNKVPKNVERPRPVPNLLPPQSYEAIISEKSLRKWEIVDLKHFSNKNTCDRGGTIYFLHSPRPMHVI